MRTKCTVNDAVRIPKNLLLFETRSTNDCIGPADKQQQRRDGDWGGVGVDGGERRGGYKTSVVAMSSRQNKRVLMASTAVQFIEWRTVP